VTAKPRPPAGTKTAGKRLWTAILDAYDLDAAELVVLREMCRVTDRLDALDDAIRASGVVEGGRVSQVLTEARQQQQTLTKLAGALRIPADQPAASTSDAARAIAEARWSGRRRGS
jgi:hypothetical protein